jgi:RNA polymerase sigma factor for flagellar operon FliA
MDARLTFRGELYTPHAPVRATPSPQALVEGHLPLVRKIAWHTHARVSTAIDIEDLVQLGMVALIEAARVYEDRGQASFSTYASMRIRGAMIDALRKHATLCRSALRRRREIAAARDSLSAELGRAPSGSELADRLGMTLAALQAALDSTHAPRHESIEDIYSDHSMWFAGDEPDALAALESADLRSALAEAIAGLPSREAQVLQLYFVEELNLEEIGQILGVGAARVCQIKKAALQKVRRQLSQWEED